MVASPYYQPRQYAPSSFTSLPSDDVALPVVVVGAGPVGMAVALGLARRGTRVTVIEAATQVSFGSRAICVSRHTLEVADRLGFGEQLSDLVLPWHGGRSFYRDTQVLHFLMKHDDHDVRGPMVNVSQSELEQVMADALEAHPLVTLHWGTAITGLIQEGNEATVTVETVDGPRILRAEWVVAADGGRSVTRDLVGTSLQGASYEGRYVIADIHWVSELPAERTVWFDPPSNPGSTVIMHRQPRDIWRIDYQLDPRQDAEVETREDRIRARITSHLEWLGNDRPWTLEWHGFYKAHALALDSFVHGRVLFAGDAAHLVPIFGVRGLNSGMEDAEALTWMLSAVLSAGADPALLQAYSAERHDAWQQNIANAGKSTLIMTPGSHGHRTTRDALLALATTRPEFSHLINPRQSSATHARRSALTLPAVASTAVDGLLPGDPLEDRRVVLADGKESSLGELRGSGFAVLGVDLAPGSVAAAERLRDDLAATFASEAATLALVCREPGSAAYDTVIDDNEGAVTRAWGTDPGEVIVIRPDGLVVARGRVEDLAGLPHHLLAGGVAAESRPGDIDAQVLVPVEEARRESAWLALSDGINAAAPDDREGFLARLSLLLGDQVSTDDFARAVASATSVR
ncbi:FAD-dependent oxidoreductase [Knoellia sp. Soil729]|uniref:FAD-dependent oxidoreductase n=1 Tax=Knoellia sp. Soil729 TaxID=1736394 RepID=UPI0006F2F4A8|nr:FAD-dependent oxidoreductase [Knoellia sp. Soil729]KRE44159.1 aromatic ring hydroxylase [Knoellia sp. Soil729]